MREIVKISIGPLVGEYGGVAQHIIHIIRYSRYQLVPITPSPWSLYYGRSPLKHRVSNFLLSRKVVPFDPYGIYVSKFQLPRSDLVHLHGNPWWPELYLRSRRSHAHYIHTVHQIYLEEDCYNKGEWEVKRYSNEFMFRSCRLADRVITVARWMQEGLREKGIDSAYIPNGVDMAACVHASAGRFRRTFGIEEDFYLFPGDIRKYKRPELFVALAMAIPSRLFVMIGSGVTAENLVKQLGIKLPSNLRCLGPLPHEAALDAYKACRVFVLPTKNEAFGISLVEAMACRRPVVAAANAGPLEIVEPGEGFLFIPDELDDLIEKAKLAWEHPEVGEAAYRKVKTQYDWPVVIQSVDNLYGDILGLPESHKTKELADELHSCEPHYDVY